MSGCAQWWPARMQTSSRPRISATSCGWTPSIANDTRVPRGLGAVDQRDRARLVRPAHDLGDRVDRAEHVGDVHDADELDVATGELAVQRVEIERAVVAHLDIAERSAPLANEQLPRHDV